MSLRAAALGSIRFDENLRGVSDGEDVDLCMRLGGTSLERSSTCTPDSPCQSRGKNVGRLATALSSRPDLYLPEELESWRHEPPLPRMVPHWRRPYRRGGVSASKTGLQNLEVITVRLRGWRLSVTSHRDTLGSDGPYACPANRFQEGRKLGRVNTKQISEGFYDQGDVKEAEKHEIELVEARENAAKAFEPAEQALDFVGRRYRLCRTARGPSGWIGAEPRG